MKPNLNKAMKSGKKAADMGRKAYDVGKKTKKITDKAKNAKRTVDKANEEGLDTVLKDKAKGKMAQKAQEIGAKVAKKGAKLVGKAVAKAAGSIISFLLTPFPGWIILGVGILIIGTVAKDMEATREKHSASPGSEQVGSAGDDQQISDDELVAIMNVACPEDDTSSSSGSNGSGTTVNTDGNLWLQKIGGKTDVADRIKEWATEQGFSGSQIAVMLAVGARESGLDPKADNPSGGVHGVWQWSNGGINGDRMAWLRNQGGDIDSLEDQFKLLKYELGTAYYNPVIQVFAKNPGSSEKEIYENLDIWETRFEGLVKSDQAQRKEEVVLQYIDAIFKHYPDLKDMPQGPNFLDNFNATSTNSSVSSDAKSDDLSGCASDDEMGTLPDWTGEVPADATAWGYKHGQLPDSLKPYAKDPSKMGLDFGGSKGWVENTGQCVDLTVSLGNIIWGHSGIVIGDGWKQAEAWASGVFKNKVKEKPTSGAIFSTGTAFPGHTGIVAHVFKNGDVLTIEQNTPLSGHTIGHINTWNYRIFTVAEQKAEHMTFAYPDNPKPNWGTKK